MATESFPEGRATAEGEISVRAAAELLRVSEKTVYRWIRQGVIPNYRVQGQYRFDREELVHWARSKRIGSSPAGTPHGEGMEETVDLLTAVRNGGIHYKVEGSTPEEIYRNIVTFFPQAPNFSTVLRETLVGTLIERERLVSTAVGHGIALPHPRHPRDWGLGQPVVGVFFLEQPVDYRALDGEPVFVLFVILCATVRVHLRMLAQVSHLVNNADMQAFLRTVPTRTELMERIEHAVAQQQPPRAGQG